jgi:tetratricopeptide (TPR) repeat protein
MNKKTQQKKIMTPMSPSSINELLFKALKFHQEGQPDKARELYKNILKIQPLNADALHLLGLLHTDEKDYNTATKLISKAVLRMPGVAIYHNSLGNAFREQQCYEDSRRHFDIALQINPSYFEAYYNCGLLLEAESKIDEACKFYEKTLEFNPTFIPGRQHLAHLSRAQGRFLLAIRTPIIGSSWVLLITKISNIWKLVNISSRLLR